MNRAARIAEKASSGALWCSQAAWMWCAETCAEGLVEFGIEAKSLGSYHLKVRGVGGVGSSSGVT
jgi:hypothetical protein